MQQQNSFQLTLPSNACLELFPKNQPNEYKTRLCRELQFSGEWEVAIIDIQYPGAIADVQEDIDGVLYLYQNEKVTKQRLDKFFSIKESSEFHASVWNYIVANDLHKYTSLLAPIKFRKGQFRNLRGYGHYIAEIIKDELKQYSDRATQVEVKFEYDALFKRAKFSLNQPGNLVLFTSLDDRTWKDIFHFPTKTIKNHLNSKTIANYVEITGPGSIKPCSVALDAPSSIYIYSDIVKHQMIGSSEAQLLGIVPIQFTLSDETSQIHAYGSELAGQQYYNFNPPYYIDLTKNTLETVTIQLNTDWGLPFPFIENPSARVVCRLHFRKREPQIL